MWLPFFRIMAIIIKPPTPLTFDKTIKSIFLAGSIEMGMAENWQSTLEKELEDYKVIILNPRRILGTVVGSKVLITLYFVSK